MLQRRFDERIGLGRAVVAVFSDGPDPAACETNDRDQSSHS